MIIAPEGFSSGNQRECVGGTVMIARHVHVRRAAPKDAQGHVDTDSVRDARVAECRARRATHEIKATGEELIVDGVRLIFQITPGTEAPAEITSIYPKSARCAWPRIARESAQRLYASRRASA